MKIFDLNELLKESIRERFSVERFYNGNENVYLCVDESGSSEYESVDTFIYKLDYHNESTQKTKTAIIEFRFDPDINMLWMDRYEDDEIIPIFWKLEGNEEYVQVNATKKNFRSKSSLVKILEAFNVDDLLVNIINKLSTFDLNPITSKDLRINLFKKLEGEINRLSFDNNAIYVGRLYRDLYIHYKNVVNGESKNYTFKFIFDHEDDDQDISMLSSNKYDTKILLEIGYGDNVHSLELTLRDLLRLDKDTIEDILFNLKRSYGCLN